MSVLLTISISIAALLLDMPMSLLWAVQQARAVFQQCDLSSNYIVIHYLGNMNAKKELA